MPIVISVAERGKIPSPLSFEGSELTFGRTQQNDVVLPRGSVSKHHARLVERDGKYILVDLRSTNGTFVNGKRINAPQVLKSSDKVVIGDYTIHLGEDPPSQSASSQSGEAAAVPEQIEWIVTLDGPDGRQQFALIGDVTVGRSSTCDIPVNHKNVGRRQLRILPFSRYVAVTDLGTALGTWVNGERLTGSARLTSSEEVIEFAAHRMWVHRPGEEPPTTTGRPGKTAGPGWKLLLRGIGGPELVTIDHEPVVVGSHPECRIQLTAPGTPERQIQFELDDSGALFVTELCATAAGVKRGDGLLKTGVKTPVAPGDLLKLSRAVSIAVQTARPLRPPPPKPEVTIPRMRVPRPRTDSKKTS